MALTDKLDAIGEAIRSKTGKTELLQLDEMPQEIRSIEGGGGITPQGTINIIKNGTHDVTTKATAVVAVPTYEAENAELTEEVAQLNATITEKNSEIERLEAEAEESYEQGKQETNDAFWDVIQNNGQRMDYQYAFANAGWTEETFNPKYEVKPTNASYMFANSAFVTLPTIDLSNINPATRQQGVFSGCGKLVTIEKLILPTGGNMAGPFGACWSLKNITVQGTFKKNNGTWSLNQCEYLTHDSLMSFVYALEDLSETGETGTMTFGATNLAKLTEAEIAIATGKGWTIT